ncbi:MAG: MBL fold metallo-hydrolase [Roseibium sp.]|uniref:MBL fold metallo-hydrolase n=1 Tax=Roseibium sp. TaxID=1936156 RepID=UPI001B24BDAC|nr:MBL fold metallo-hydrolase [Roseibium sp.]MBO6891103.1 MBL fold metallo-hydrolase [Roseibium sp.]MBO6928437.1 MBL fold metallo-hydrolase [Roseibium sp.]
MAKTTTNSEAVPGENERFEKLGHNCYAYSADGCSNTGVVIGDKGVLIVDAQATPEHAQRVLAKLRDISDTPVKQVVLTHFHADNSLGAHAFEPSEIIASDLTRRMMDTRGRDEISVSKQRSAALLSSVPDNVELSEPSMTIASSMTIDLGGLEVRLMHLGRGHTMGDMVVWVPESGVIFAGDLVQETAAPYCGDAHLADWPRALDRIAAFRPNALMPGRGRSALDAAAVTSAVENTREYITLLRDAAEACVEQSLGLKDTFNAVQDALAPRFGSKTDFEGTLPFNVARAYDEALGLDQPQVWTLERVADLQDALNGIAPVGHEDVSTQPEEVISEEAVVEDQAAEEIEANEDTGDLVSESEFAASLVLDEGAELEDEAAAPEDEMALDLSADDIVEPEQGEPEVSGEANDDEVTDGLEEKVLEDARY